MPHTVLLLRKKMRFETLEELTAAFGLPVVSFWTQDASGGCGITDSARLSRKAREQLAFGVYEMYRAVRPVERIGDPLTYSQDALRSIRATVDDLERAIAEGESRWLIQASEDLRGEVEGLCFSLSSWDAEQPFDTPQTDLEPDYRNGLVRRQP
jgi:hypothetical protein